ncbi:hypothetical protein APTSU1_001139300 [Apodemus speciosus]|uniref:Uncharacterized protein n=1 Tax=Apodemus speciosus TaxID=105296 RepID=A0ABQ0FA82_APOSI
MQCSDAGAHTQDFELLHCDNSMEIHRNKCRGPGLPCLYG